MMLMKSRRTFLASLSLVLAFAANSHATTYTYTKIAESADVYSNFWDAAMNDSGSVAFAALLDDGEFGIYRGDGVAVTTIAVTNGQIASLGGPLGVPAFYPSVSINSSGMVAFEAYHTNGNDSIFVGDGGPLTTIVDGSGSFSASLGSFPSINDAGTVAFRGIGPEWLSVLTGSGGPISTVYSFFTNNVWPYYPAINNNGQVAFVDIGFFPSNTFSIRTGNGGSLTTIAVTNELLSAFGLVVDINDDGTVIFNAQTVAGDWGIYIGNGGPITLIADTNGPFASVGGLSINNLGEVAIWAELDAGGSGVFTGPNPLTDKVIQTGDSLDGSIVIGASTFFRGGINDNGQIVFRAGLEDGRLGIFRADPIPEPSALAFLGVASLVFFYRRK